MECKDRLAKEAAMEMHKETGVVTVCKSQHQIQVAAKIGYWCVWARFLHLQTLLKK